MLLRSCEHNCVYLRVSVCLRAVLNRNCVKHFKLKSSVAQVNLSDRDQNIEIKKDYVMVNNSMS